MQLPRLLSAASVLLAGVGSTTASNCRPRKPSPSSSSSSPLSSSTFSSSLSLSLSSSSAASSQSSSTSKSYSISSSFSSSSSSTPAAPTATNLIQNGGFDNLIDDASSPPVPWVAYQGGFGLSSAEYVSEPYAASSSYATGTGYTNFWISQAVDSSLWEPNTPYTVSAWVYASGSNCADAAIGCAYEASTAPTFMFASYKGFSMGVAANAQWLEVTATCFPPASNLANDPGVAIIVSCSGGSSWIDNVTLVPAPDAVMPLPSEANGFTNGGFDDAADDATGKATPWTYTSSTALPITLASQEYLSAPYSLAMNFTSTTAASVGSLAYSIPSTTWDYAYSYNFTFSAYIESNHPENAASGCTYLYYGFTETIILTASYLTTYSTKDTTVSSADEMGTWITRSVIFPPSADGVSAHYGGTLGIRIQPSCMDATVYLDNFTLEPVLPFVW
ncbi:hypothetical protein SBRCBS47491_004694 [Sporothrix bragantina]|uniref:CBM-cenC domain-containing protein n=1 Tax=Sporothrix bragantina TaxID=671064 RepID=A0ABP0BQX8_9PEZI